MITETLTHDDAGGQLLRHTPVKHPGRVEASWVLQGVAETIDFASHDVVVVTLVHSRHRRTKRPAACTHKLTA